MDGKKKYLTAGVTVAVLALMGATLFAHPGAHGSSLSKVTPGKYTRSSQDCANAMAQCPYYECPYLNHLLKMGKVKNVPLEEAAGICPYEMRSGHGTLKRTTHRNSVVLADEALIRQTDEIKVKTVRLNKNR